MQPVMVAEKKLLPGWDYISLYCASICCRVRVRNSVNIKSKVV